MLNIVDVKANDIYNELRTLKIATYANAGAVLLRVFLELSIDKFLDTPSVKAYINGRSLTIGERTPLKLRLGYTCDYLESNGVMNKDQVQPYRKAAEGNSFLATSISSFNAYVHSPYSMPHLNDLKATWDEFQPLVEHIWG